MLLEEAGVQLRTVDILEIFMHPATYTGARSGFVCLLQTTG